MVSDAFWEAGLWWKMLANCLFSRNPERPFDIERPRNWGSFGAELNGLKPWRRGETDAFGRLEAFGRLLVEAFWEAG